MKLLVVAEHSHAALQASSLSAVTAGLQICEALDVLVIGYQCGAAAAEAARLSGVAGVWQVDDPVHAHFLAESASTVLARMVATHAYSHVLFPASAFGRNLAPRVAAMLDVAPVTDVLRIVDEDTFVHPIHAGNVLETLRSTDAVKLLSVRPAAFAAVSRRSHAAPITLVEAGPDVGMSRFLSNDLPANTRPELHCARVVVAGGRGLGSQAAFQTLLEPLADRLGGALGATRAAVDAGFLANDLQIGQTGKAVAPDVYFAIGLSGAIQHVAGMRGARLVVAINKDAEAPIFEHADLGLIGDVHEILPQLLAALQR